MYENNDQLQKSSHRLLTTHPHKLQMAISDNFLLFKLVVLPRSACWFSQLLFLSTCTNSPRTLIVYEKSSLFIFKL